jgi:hypothetical protein
MPDYSTEKYQEFLISWVIVPSFKISEYNSTHGVELYYQIGRQKTLIAFIEGYQWYRNKRGFCEVYILSRDSEEWKDLTNESEKLVLETRNAVHIVLKNGLLSGKVEGNIYAHANA